MDGALGTRAGLGHDIVFEGDEYAYSEAKCNHQPFVCNPDLKVVVFPYVAVEYGRFTPRYRSARE
ncbi:MAG: hypothetical protein MUF54_12310 [Polyangiaceae bacterium]|jgi:hypothetical protein|nr:hypothetical protein [Polyangiaceae bacterium]